MPRTLFSALMLPGIMTLIPEFLLFKQIGWLNTFLPLIVPWSLGGHALGIFLFRQYTMTIPLGPRRERLHIRVDVRHGSTAS